MSDAGRVALSPQGEAIMRTLVPVVLGPLLPADRGAREDALTAGMAALDDYLAHLSLPLQRQARLLLGVLDLLPVRLLLLGTWSRWRDVAPERIEAFLLRARGSRLRALRRCYVSLQAMAVIAWFDLPLAWDEIGYPGPPIERSAAAGASS
jgi:hypothetical protein